MDSQEYAGLALGEGIQGPTISTWKVFRAGFEKCYIENLMVQCGGNQTEAAKHAGINRGVLGRRIAQYGIIVEFIKAGNHD